MSFLRGEEVSLLCHVSMKFCGAPAKPDVLCHPEQKKDLGAMMISDYEIECEDWLAEEISLHSHDHSPAVNLR